MAMTDQSKLFKQRAVELRKIAAKSKFKVGRRLANKMADEWERLASPDKERAPSLTNSAQQQEPS